MNFIEWPANVLIVYGGNKLLPSYGRNLHILLFNDGLNRLHTVLEKSGFSEFLSSCTAAAKFCNECACGVLFLYKQPKYKKQLRQKL